MSTEPQSDPACGAVVRRNTIDGRLYPCEFPWSDPVHGSVEACSTALGVPCRAPYAHHAFEPFPEVAPESELERAAARG